MDPLGNDRSPPVSNLRRPPWERMLWDAARPSASRYDFSLPLRPSVVGKFFLLFGPSGKKVRQISSVGRWRAGEDENENCLQWRVAIKRCPK